VQALTGPRENPDHELLSSPAATTGEASAHQRSRGFALAPGPLRRPGAADGVAERLRHRLRAV